MLHPHLVKRGLQRLGHGATEADLSEIQEILRAGGGKVIPTGSHGPTQLVRLFWKRQYLRCIYDHANQRLLSILPLFVSGAAGHGTFKLGKAARIIHKETP